MTATTDMNGRTLGFRYNAASARTQTTYSRWGEYRLCARQPEAADQLRLELDGRSVLADLCQCRHAHSVDQGGGSTIYSFDTLGRLSSMANDLSGSVNDVAWNFTDRNPSAPIMAIEDSAALYDYRETARRRSAARSTA